MRKQLKESQAEISKKDNELNLLKKNFKYTKINELEVELKTQMDELFRLRNMLQQALKINEDRFFYFILGEELFKDRNFRGEGNISLEEKYLIQMNTINTLKRDNVEMAAIIKKMEEDIHHLKVQYYFLFIIFRNNFSCVFQLKNQEMERVNQKNLKEKNLMKKFFNEREREMEKKHEENENGFYKQKNLNQIENQTNNEVTQLKQDLE